MDFEPPNYFNSEVPRPLPAPAESRYYAAPTGSQHIAPLQGRKGFEWLTLTVNSCTSASSLPIFYEGDIITGQVDLDVLKSESIKGISVKVATEATLTGQEAQLSPNSETDLWTPSIPLPDGSKVTKFTKGKYSWPFSLAFPARFEGQEQRATKFPLPTSFPETAGVGYIDYKLIVTVKRGVFRLNNILIMTLAYVPANRQEIPSPMFQKAYNEGCEFIGSEGDASGWRWDGRFGWLPSSDIRRMLSDSVMDGPPSNSAAYVPPPSAQIYCPSHCCTCSESIGSLLAEVHHLQEAVEYLRWRVASLPPALSPFVPGMNRAILPSLPWFQRALSHKDSPSLLHKIKTDTSLYVVPELPEDVAECCHVQWCEGTAVNDRFIGFDSNGNLYMSYCYKGTPQSRVVLADQEGNLYQPPVPIQCTPPPLLSLLLSPSL